MDDAALAALKAATTNTASSKLAKKIRVVNTAVKHAHSGNTTPQASVSPNGMLNTPGTRSPSSDHFVSATSPGMDVFDDADVDSRAPVVHGNSKKRKSPTFKDRLGSA